MANQKIHEYLLEKFSIGDDDYFDIDFFNGTFYETAKVKGVVIKALASGITIYNSDGQLDSDRVVDGDNFGLEFQNLNYFSANVLGVTPQTDLIQISGNPTNLLAGTRLFTIYDIIANKRRFAILKTGEVQINEEYTLPLTDGSIGQALVTDGLGAVNFQNVVDSNYVNFGQTQWSVTAPATVLPSGQIANGFSFFTEANKLVAGTTAYDEYFLSWGRVLTLTGTSGSADINILGVDYPINFVVGLTATASLFVTNNQATLNALGIQVFAVGSIIKFGSITQTDVSTITITNTAGTLNGTLNTEINDHVVIPYTGTVYASQRLTHSIRVNFNIDTGNSQFYALSLRKWQDDSVIGSIIQVQRNTILTGQQEVFISYTAGALDSFVTGGFYFALENNSGQNVTISGSAGILIITEYQKPTKF